MAEISDFINQVLDQDFANAQPTFAELIGGKMNDALEQEKIAVADQVFNGVEPTEDPDDEEQLEMNFDEDDIEVDEEEFEAALEDDESDE